MKRKSRTSTQWRGPFSETFARSSIRKPVGKASTTELVNLGSNLARVKPNTLKLLDVITETIQSFYLTWKKCAGGSPHELTSTLKSKTKKQNLQIYQYLARV